MFYFILGAVTLAIVEWVWITYFKDDSSNNRYSASGDSSAGSERKLQELKNRVSDREAQIGHLQARISVMEKDADRLASSSSRKPGESKKKAQPQTASKPKVSPKKKAVAKAAVKKKTVAKAPVKKKAAVKSPAKKKAASRPDDLKKVSGIGPKIAGLMKADGIDSFATLAKASNTQLDGILKKAGSRFSMADASSWPKQASLLQQGDLTALGKLQKSLKNQ